MATTKKAYDRLVNNLLSNPCNGFNDEQFFEADMLVSTCLRFNSMTNEIHNFSINEHGYADYDKPVSLVRAGQLIRECISMVKNGLSQA